MAKLDVELPSIFLLKQNISKTNLLNNIASKFLQTSQNVRRFAGLISFRSTFHLFNFARLSSEEKNLVISQKYVAMTKSD